MSVTKFPTEDGAGALMWRLARFLLGLGAGCALALALTIAVNDAYSSAHNGNANIRAAGTDMSAVGASKLQLARGNGVVTLICNGPCDDLSLTTVHGAGKVVRVRIVDSHGVCLACVDGRGAVPTGSRDDWTISGESRLSVRAVRSKEAPRG